MKGAISFIQEGGAGQKKKKRNSNLMAFDKSGDFSKKLIGKENFFVE